jgi:hypothetical protein
MATINAIGTPTITLGGTFTMSGGYTFTGTITGNTTVTFPTSGTLLTQAESLIWAANSNSTITAAFGNGYILTSGSATTVTLPAGTVGGLIGIAGSGAAWTCTLSTNSVTIKQFGNTYSTSIASTNNTDSVLLLCTTTSDYTMLAMTTTGFTAS